MLYTLQNLTPTRVVESLSELEPSVLKEQGIAAIITDLDNTLVPWQHYEIMPGVIEWLAKLEVAGIKICIASNTIHTERLKQLADTMNIPFVDRVQKPRTGGFLRAMKLMGSNVDNTAVFGDQLFTDILAGNRLKLHTILLRPPLSKEEFVSTQLVRYVENGVIRKLRERGQWPAAAAVEAALDAMPDPRTPEAKHRSTLAIAAIIGLVVILIIRARRKS
ncbi:MAG: YqeG family HAD IIIA-type phosphatase [Janthinobacterium lividum]